VATDATLVDSNVLLDLATNDPSWADWSQTQLEVAAGRGALWINDIVYAELSVRFDRIEVLDAFCSTAGLVIEAMPLAALFLAGKAFGSYRARGGPKTAVLPDFLIGAHAAVAAVPLLTRDVRRYRTAFPSLELIVPAAD